MSDPNLVQIAIDFLGAADLEQALLKANHLLTIPTGSMLHVRRNLVWLYLLWLYLLRTVSRPCSRQRSR